MEEDRQTRGERRETRQGRRRKMGVSGRSVRKLQEIILRRSRAARRTRGARRRG